MKNLGQKILIIVILAALAVGVGYYVNSQKAPSQYKQGLYPVSRELAGKTIVLSDYIHYPGEEGKDAFELLKKAVSGKVEAKQYDFGVMVESINGGKPDKDHFWKLYINGKESQVGADKLVTHKGDVVEWVVEKINK